MFCCFCFLSAPLPVLCDPKQFGVLFHIGSFETIDPRPRLLPVVQVRLFSSYLLMALKIKMRSGLVSILFHLVVARLRLSLPYCDIDNPYLCAFLEMSDFFDPLYLFINFFKRLIMGLAPTPCLVLL